MAIALISVPSSHQTPKRFYTNNSTWLHSNLQSSIKYPYKPLTVPLSSSSSSATEVVEDGPSPPSPEPAAQLQSESATTEADTIPFRGCKACGREEVERGCNGEGRIQGGIATVPGFGWWPIKAYRPCPGFVASGGRYRRRGQTMDEVAFGRTEPLSSINAGDKAESSKKQSGKKLKR